MKNLIKTSTLAIVILFTLTSCDPAGVRDNDIELTPYVMEYTSFDLSNYEVNEVDAESFSSYNVQYGDDNEIIVKSVEPILNMFYSGIDQVSVSVEVSNGADKRWVYVNVEGAYYMLMKTQDEDIYSSKIAGLDNITLIEDAVIVTSTKICSGDVCTVKKEALKVNF